MTAREAFARSGVASPAYLYDLGELRRAHAQLCAALPQPSRLYYSLKANPHPRIVSTLAEQGCAAEVCSPGELMAALAAGVAPQDMLYTGPGKRDQDVAEALRHGVTLFSVDSPYGIEQLGREARRQSVDARCIVRVNDRSPAPGQGLTMTGMPSQFGADRDWIEADPRSFRSRAGVRVVGLHLYMGSNLTGQAALTAQFDQAIATAAQLAPLIVDRLELINLGGGFGAPFARAGDIEPLPDLAKQVAALLDEAFPGWPAGTPTVAFESGRYLTATCGTLLTRVLDRKISHGKPVLVLESGINHLGGMSGLRRLPVIRPTLDGDGPTTADAMVTGPLCTPLDTWARGAEVVDAAPGDLLAVPNVGAYGLQASLIAFLGHPAPAEVVHEGARVVEATRLTPSREKISVDGRTA